MNKILMLRYKALSRAVYPVGLSLLSEMKIADFVKMDARDAALMQLKTAKIISEASGLILQAKNTIKGISKLEISSIFNLANTVKKIGSVQDITFFVQNNLLVSNFCIQLLSSINTNTNINTLIFLEKIGLVAKKEIDILIRTFAQSKEARAIKRYSQIIIERFLQLYTEESGLQRESIISLEPLTGLKAGDSIGLISNYVVNLFNNTCLFLEWFGWKVNSKISMASLFRLSQMVRFRIDSSIISQGLVEMGLYHKGKMSIRSALATEESVILTRTLLQKFLEYEGYYQIGSLGKIKAERGNLQIFSGFEYNSAVGAVTLDGQTLFSSAEILFNNYHKLSFQPIVSNWPIKTTKIIPLEGMVDLISRVGKQLQDKGEIALSDNVNLDIKLYFYDFLSDIAILNTNEVYVEKEVFWQKFSKIEIKNANEVYVEKEAFQQKFSKIEIKNMEKIFVAKNSYSSQSEVFFSSILSIFLLNYKYIKIDSNLQIIYNVLLKSIRGIPFKKMQKVQVSKTVKGRIALSKSFQTFSFNIFESFIKLNEASYFNIISSFSYKGKQEFILRLPMALVHAFSYMHGIATVNNMGPEAYFDQIDLDILIRGYLYFAEKALIESMASIFNTIVQEGIIKIKNEKIKSKIKAPIEWCSLISLAGENIVPHLRACLYSVQQVSGDQILNPVQLNRYLCIRQSHENSALYAEEIEPFIITYIDDMLYIDCEV